MEYVKVKDHKNLVRDPISNGIINTNTSEYEEYISRRDAAIKAKETSSDMKEDLDNLKSEMNEIKSLLKELVNGH
tara:strand:+ start:244 stop:468 length:225 start_codon:yes stop_codon:yes gene_type:complete